MAEDSTADLTLPQAFTLLLIEADGKRAADANTLGIGIAGAILADLALRGAVSLEGGRVTVQPTEATLDDDVLEASRGSIAANGKPRPAKWWVSKLAGRETRDAVAMSLVALGLLGEEQRKILGVFNSTVYPEVDGAPEADLRSLVSAVLAEDEDPTPYLAALVALLDATGTLHKQFGRVPHGTVRTITSGSTWAAPAVKDVLDQIRASAIAVVAASAATGAAVSGSVG
jgi:hypothetical protein